MRAGLQLISSAQMRDSLSEFCISKAVALLETVQIAFGIPQWDDLPVNETFTILASDLVRSLQMKFECSRRIQPDDLNLHASGLSA